MFRDDETTPSIETRAGPCTLVGARPFGLSCRGQISAPPPRRPPRARSAGPDAAQLPKAMALFYMPDRVGGLSAEARAGAAKAAKRRATEQRSACDTMILEAKLRQARIQDAADRAASLARGVSTLASNSGMPVPDVETPRPIDIPDDAADDALPLALDAKDEPAWKQQQRAPAGRDADAVDKKQAARKPPTKKR